MTYAGIPDLWFNLPPGFLQFDLEEDAEARMLRMADVASSIYPSATPDQHLSLVVSGEYILQTMIAAGAEHVSSCLLRMPGDKLSQGTLCVLIERPDTGPLRQNRQDAAERTARQWRELYPEADVGLVMLPYGISALCMYEQALQIPGALFGLDEPRSTTVRQAQFCLPLKTGPGSALFVFTTEDTEHWDDYLEVLAGIMKSVSAEEPLGDDSAAAGAPAMKDAERVE
ncbi:hypothetical protein [Streptomyces boninensis]|uniref:hypothetical protein n=1 Tax=Streptomyces boninensis TaxID=2039455 RepID=UPI003B22132A